jgi:Xaa-Pro aminopeptidase
VQTMHPSIMLGSYVWAQDRLPGDEFRLRLEDLGAHMDRHGWEGMLIYGDAREHTALAYLSNFIPRMRWGMALVPRHGESRLLCSMSTRDLPAMRTMTCIADVHSGWEWDNAFTPWFARFKGESTVNLGTIGFDLMTPALQESVRRSIGERFALHRADTVLRLLGRAKRPRELSVMRDACKVLDAAARAMLESWQRNSEPETAALDGERVARAMAAQDVRTLVSVNGGRTLIPFQGRFETSPNPLAAYVAVKVGGYWADMFVTAGIRSTAALHHAEAALDALVAAVWPGVAAPELYEKAISALRPYKLHPALGNSVGHGIGLSLHEGTEFREGCRGVLVEDGVYTLQVGVADPPSGYILMSAIVRNTVKGAEVLACSPSAIAS